MTCTNYAKAGLTVSIRTHFQDELFVIGYSVFIKSNIPKNIFYVDVIITLTLLNSAQTQELL